MLNISKKLAHLYLVGTCLVTNKRSSVFLPKKISNLSADSVALEDEELTQ